MKKYIIIFYILILGFGNQGYSNNSKNAILDNEILNLSNSSVKDIQINKSLNIEIEEYFFIGLGIDFYLKIQKHDSLYSISDIKINKIIDSTIHFNIDSFFKMIKKSKLKLKKIRNENFYTYFNLVDSQYLMLDTMIFIPITSINELNSLKKYENINEKECKVIVNKIINLKTFKNDINDNLFYAIFIFNSELIKNNINPYVKYETFFDYCSNKN